ncbi:MobA/MobL family protein [Sphingomonas turrisvirgatae]|nr:MobA/MobL family protein [Sphingomonas turrisvirgatae]
MIELPAGISPHDRMAIVQHFCAKLEQLERNEHGAAIGMMYTAVIHAPDDQNDERNYHLHVIAYDRPCRFLVEHGEWDFAVPETYIHRGQRRTRYPYRQNKVTVSQSQRVSGREDSGKHFLKTLRTMFADSANHVLAARKADRRLHPGTYADCGIDREPTRHLGGMYRAEQIGVATVRGDENAAIIWADRAREIYTNNLNRRIAVLGALDRVAGATKAYADAAALRELQEIEARMAGEAKSLLALKLEYDLFRLNEEKARSRADVVRSYCDEQIDGRASDTVRSRREREDLIRRRAEAMSYLEALDRDIAAERERLAAIGRSLMARDTQLTKDLMAVDRLIGRLASEEVTREATRPAVAEDHTDASDMPLPPAASPALTRVRLGASEKAAAPKPHSNSGAGQRDDPEPLNDRSPSPAARASADESPPPPTLADSRKVEAATQRAGPAPFPEMAPGAAADRTEDSKPDIANTGREVAASGPLKAVPDGRTEKPAATPQPLPALPIRLGGKMSDGHRRIDILLKRIAEQRLEVVRTDEVMSDQYAVPALHAELAAFRIPSQMMRINLALKARYRFQEREIDRLLDWMVAADPVNAAGLDAALARAPKAIQTLYANLRNHKRVSAFLTAIQKSGVERGAPMPATVPMPGKVGKSDVLTSGPKASPAADEGGGKPSRAAMTEETRVAVSRDQGDADFQLLAAYQHLLGGRGR